MFSCISNISWLTIPADRIRVDPCESVVERLPLICTQRHAGKSVKYQPENCPEPVLKTAMGVLPVLRNSLRD
jgi:hypothetical protein